MSLTNYRTLGRSGLIVSPLCLGTMTFGQDGWGVDERAASEIFDAYRHAGGNFVDTADVYSGGASEAMVGRFIKDAGIRDQIVLATKFGFNSTANSLDTERDGAGNPNAGGAGAKNIHRALDASLERLGTDYVDLYWMHVWDGVTPTEEIVQTMGDLVRAGKVRYYGFSDMPAWVAMKAATIAQERRVPGPIALQLEYSLVARSIEEEHMAVAREARMGVMPWSPLAGGFLTGKYAQGEEQGAGRLSGANPFGDSKFSDRNWAILDALRDVAAAQDRPMAQVALAWTLSNRAVASTIIGATKRSHLEDSFAALDVRFEPDQAIKLAEVSAPDPGFTGGLAGPAIRRMVFGGNDVAGWEEGPRRD